MKEYSFRFRVSGRWMVVLLCPQRGFSMKFIGFPLGRSRLLSWAVLIFALAVALPAQVTVTLSGGDPGEGLTLDASRVVYAYNLNGSGNVTWQNVVFSPLTIGVTDPTFTSTTVDPFAGQTSTNDNALRSLLQSLAWDDGGGQALRHEFTGLTAGATYRLDVLQFSGYFAAREQAIIANGSLVGILEISQTVGKNTSFTAQADSSGMITLLLAQSGAYGGTGNQDGAIYNAVVLSSIPEPSTYALVVGVMAIGAAIWRRRLIR